jgi:hypothetical protein
MILQKKRPVVSSVQHQGLEKVSLFLHLVNDIGVGKHSHLRPTDIGIRGAMAASVPYIKGCTFR